MIKKIALVVPLFINSYEQQKIVEYQGFEYIAAYLYSKGFKVDIIDCFVEKLSIENLVSRLNSEEYSLIGFTLMSSDYLDNVKKILSLLKKDVAEKVKTAAGGYFATSMQEKILLQNSNIDYVIVGEGEYTFYELLLGLENNNIITEISGLIYRDKNNNIIKNQPRPVMTSDELNSLPMPIHHNVKNVIKENGIVQISSSRGCYGCCTFCGVHLYYQTLNCYKWRSLKPLRVVKEIQELYKKYNIDHLEFVDDNFIGYGKYGKERAKEISRLLISNNIHIKFSIYCRVNDVDFETFRLLKEAGLNRVFLGIEFGVQDTLNFYKKGITKEQIIHSLKVLRDLNIKVIYGYIMFEPLMSIETFRENFKFYRKYCKFTLGKLISKLAIYKNSIAYQQLKSRIQVNEQTVFNEGLGDICEYSFFDKQISVLYNSLKKGLQCMAPSKSYRYINKNANLYNRKYLTKEWRSGICDNVDNIAIMLKQENIDKDTDLLMLNEKYSRILKENLIKWEEEFFHKVVNVIQNQ